MNKVFHNQQTYGALRVPMFGFASGVFAFLLLATYYFLLAGFASAQILEGTTFEGAKISLSPEVGTFGVGKTFTLNITVDATKPFNSANATLNFDKELLAVQSISKTSSAFSLWAVEPAFSNSAGTVNFEGGNTTPLSGKRTLLSVTFKALKIGDAKLSFNPASVLAADGKGTDILSVKTASTYQISASAVEPPTPPPSPANIGGSGAQAGPLPDPPEITSSTHADEKKYYNPDKAKFTWELPFDVTVVRMAFDVKDNTVPITSYDPAPSEKEYDVGVDGAMYFHLRYKNDSGWGPPAHKKILIDRTPPADIVFEIGVEGSSTDAIATISATDTLSGVERYELAVDTASPVKLTPQDVRSGTYTIVAQGHGEHSATLTVFDKAGNSSKVEKTYVISGELPGTKKAADEEEVKPTDWRLYIDIFLIAIIAFLIGYLWYERRAFRHEKYLAKREADELRDNLGNVFAAMREEIDEQVSQLYQQPSPSPKDRQVTESMNEAIDLSEELISKEVEDVRKLLM